MTDLAKRLPPPMTPAELALSKVMKQVGPGFTALLTAIGRPNLRLVQLLLDHGAEVRLAYIGSGGSTPLHFAVTSTEGAALEITKAILQRKPDVNAPDREGYTPLERAFKTQTNPEQKPSRDKRPSDLHEPSWTNKGHTKGFWDETAKLTQREVPNRDS